MLTIRHLSASHHWQSDVICHQMGFVNGPEFPDLQAKFSIAYFHPNNSNDTLSNFSSPFCITYSYNILIPLSYHSLVVVDARGGRLFQRWVCLVPSLS